MKVASSTSAAQSAVSGVKSVSVNRGEQVSLEKSNISIYGIREKNQQSIIKRFGGFSRLCSKSKSKVSKNC